VADDDDRRAVAVKKALDARSERVGGMPELRVGKGPVFAPVSDAVRNAVAGRVDTIEHVHRGRPPSEVLVDEAGGTKVAGTIENDEAHEHGEVEGREKDDPKSGAFPGSVQSAVIEAIERLIIVDPSLRREV
jgi:hypothetical protein